MGKALSSEDRKVNRHASLWFGIVPSAFMSVLSLGGLAMLTGWQLVVIPAAFVGTAGLICAHLGFDDKNNIAKRATVVVMLVMGELVMLRALIPVLTQLADQQKAVGWKIFSLVFTLGPTVIGALYIYRIYRDARSRSELAA